jgi:hypothetical protein
LKKKKEKITQICKENNVLLQEFKEISEILNDGDQMIIEGEEMLGTNQTLPMNIHNSVKSKMIKKNEKRKENKKGKRQKCAIFRKVINSPQLTNRKISEKLRNPPDENFLDEEAKLYYYWKTKLKCRRNSLTN